MEAKPRPPHLPTERVGAIAINAYPAPHHATIAAGSSRLRTAEATIPTPIYLDGLSTTPLAPEAREAMLAAWEQPGNPGSPHAAGERAAAIVELARGGVADLIGSAPAEIVLTSGATEANNLAITGAALAARSSGSARRHLVVSAIEHKSVLAPALRLREAGFAVDVAPVTADGVLDIDAFASLVRDDTLLVSVMAANNETGVIQPVADAAAVARRSGALVHCDAAQAVGKIPVNVSDLDIDYLSASSHKMHGPSGVGALFVSSAAPAPAPLAVGGGQERGLRPGTEPVALVAGFGAAARIARERLGEGGWHANAILSRFLSELSGRQVRFSVNGEGALRIPGAASIAMEGVDAQSLAQSLAREIMISTGSACNSGQISTSHVLEAMGLHPETARSTFRVYFDSYTSLDDAIRAGAGLAQRAPLHT